MSTLPSAIDPDQEKLLNDILDEGINQVHNSISNITFKEYNKEEMENINIKPKQDKSHSALAQAIEEAKNSNILQETHPQNYDNFQSELSFLQGKIRSLEASLGCSSKPACNENGIVNL